MNPALLKLPALIAAAGLYLLTALTPIEYVIQGAENQIEEENRMLEGTIIFDNGGGITVQLPNFAHSYNDPEQAARDIADYLSDGTTDGWEGHEDDAAELDPTTEQVHNGGYRIYTMVDVVEIIKDTERESSWGNINDFCSVLTDLIK
jgi:hypothetical protein